MAHNLRAFTDVKQLHVGVLIPIITCPTPQLVEASKKAGKQQTDPQPGSFQLGMKQLRVLLPIITCPRPQLVKANKRTGKQ